MNPKSLMRTSTSPIPVRRTTRRHDVRVLTSMPAGKMVPLAAIPLLREDAVTRANFMLSFEMMETVELLMNAVNVNVKAYLVPNLAFERFASMDELNRAYNKVEGAGGEVISYVETIPGPATHGANEILLYMGKHSRPGTNINSAYIEAYNAIWNFRAKNRSPDITLRDRLADELAPAFWQHTAFAHIVPDFDQAVIDGEVALNITNGQLPLSGSGLDANGRASLINRNTSRTIARNPSTGAGETFGASSLQSTGSGLQVGGSQIFNVDVTGHTVADLSNVFAEMQSNGITVSLSNIELARKTQAFASLRLRYNGHSDDYIIDMLMNGLSIPEQAWRQPILLGERSTIFGMAKRYASDGENLTESVVNGMAALDMSVSVPQVPCGGLVMLVAEITPEQLFERQRDPYLFLSDVDELPSFLRDELDPEKVEIVPCEYVDIDHDTPNATFGYAPLNHQWNHAAPCIGGRFFRPEVDAAFDEDRQRIWAVETQNPVLSADFYLCTTMHTKPFVVTNQDPFEAVVRGQAMIRGNTVFGGLLVEATGDYDAVLAEAPLERIEK